MVRDSYALSVRPLKIDYKIVVDNVKLLCDVFDYANKIKKVYDETEQLRTNLAIGTMQRTAIAMTNKQIMANGAIILIDLPKWPAEEKKKDEEGKDYLTPFSDN